MWPLSILTTLYELSYKYKVLKYRGASTISLIVKLFDKKEFDYISIHGADTYEVEQLLKKEGFEVRNLCREQKELRIEKVSKNKFLIDC
jgi:hypothetical protein